MSVTTDGYLLHAHLSERGKMNEALTCENDADKLKKIKKINFLKICIADPLYVLGHMFTSGAIIQSFLLLLGFGEWEVYVYSSIGTFGQVAVMMLMALFSSRIVKIKRWLAIFSVSLCLPAVLFIIAVVFPSVMSVGYVIAVYVVTLISSLGLGIRSILGYSLPIQVIGVENYGRFTGISTAVAGAANFGMSFLHTMLASMLEYKLLTAWCCVLAIGMMILSAFIILSLREISENVENRDTPTGQSRIAVFKNRDTYLLVLPNIARGFATGIMNVITVIGIANSLMQPEQSSYVNIVLQAALLIANVVFATTYKKLSARLMIAVCSVVCAVTLPLCLSFGTVEFLLFYFIAVAFRYVIDSAIPTLIVEIIPENQLSAYTSIRMLLYIGAQGIVTLLITPMVSAVGYGGILIFASAMQIICGTGYVLVSCLHSKRKDVSAK